MHPYQGSWARVRGHDISNRAHSTYIKIYLSSLSLWNIWVCVLLAGVLLKASARCGKKSFWIHRTPRAGSLAHSSLARFFGPAWNIFSRFMVNKFLRRWGNCVAARQISIKRLPFRNFYSLFIEDRDKQTKHNIWRLTLRECACLRTRWRDKWVARVRRSITKMGRKPLLIYTRWTCILHVVNCKSICEWEAQIY